MPNLAQVMKEEVRRLARKEIREATDAMKKQVAQQRRDIAALKRTNEQLTRRLNVLEKQEKQRGGKVAPAPEDSAGIRFSAKGLASHRERLGLSAADMGELIGVTGQTIYAWEQGRSRPRDSQLPAIAIIRDMGVREARAKLNTNSEKQEEAEG